MVGFEGGVTVAVGHTVLEYSIYLILKKLHRSIFLFQLFLICFTASDKIYAPGGTLEN